MLKMSYRKYRIAGLILLAVIVASAFLTRAFFTPKMAPEVSFTLLSGQSLSMSALRGKVTIVHFWATSCTTCIREMPQLMRVYEQLQPRNLEMIAVAMSYDPPMYVSHYTQTRQLPFKVAMDSDGRIARAFGNVQLTPTTFVIDQRGHIIKHYVGEPTWPSFQALLEQTLTKS